MEAMEVVRAAAKAADMPLSRIGLAMGKPSTYVSNSITRGSSPQSNTLASMLDVCGWALVAVPKDAIPENALILSGRND